MPKINLANFGQARNCLERERFFSLENPSRMMRTRCLRTTLTLEVVLALAVHPRHITSRIRNQDKLLRRATDSERHKILSHPGVCGRPQRNLRQVAASIPLKKLGGFPPLSLLTLVCYPAGYRLLPRVVAVNKLFDAFLLVFWRVLGELRGVSVDQLEPGNRVGWQSRSKSLLRESIAGKQKEEGEKEGNGH